MVVCALLHDFGTPVSRVLGFESWEFLVESMGGVVFGNGNRTCFGCSNNTLWMSMTFRVWFEYGDSGCDGRSSLVGRYVCIDGF